MKKIISLLILGQICLNTIAQTEKNIESEIRKVTVYQEGAEITRQGNVDLKKGNTTLIFKGLSSKLDAKSIRAKGDNNLMIVSVSQNIDYLNKIKVTTEIEKLEKLKLSIKDSISSIDGLTKVYQQEKEMILANKNIGGDNGVNINDLKNAATFFRSRLMEIEAKSKQLEKQKFNHKLVFIETSKQLLELNSKSDLPTSIIKVVVSAKSSLNYNLELNYIVNDASWIPNYDLRIVDINQPMNLFYKAKISQNTDEDWENVKLTLSTGNPSISNYKPELSTYYLTFNNFYKTPSTTSQKSMEVFRGTVHGKITDSESGEPLIGGTVMVKGTTQGTVADINGEYKINMPSDKNILVFSYIGYENQEKHVNSGQMNVSLTPSFLEMEEVVVIGYGVNSSGFQGRSSNVNIAKKKEHVPLAIEKRQTSTEFEIEIPYSIPSDNQAHDVTMIEYEVPAEYLYSAVPKLSHDVYLTAKIPDWTNYEMISGNANLFFQGIYQGETYLDLKGFEDTLSVSIGRDKNIMISREIQKDFSKKSTFGSNKKELKFWEITIKNNKNTQVDLVLEDQFPISKVDDIKIDRIETSGGTINEDDGKITWNLKLEPKEKKVVVIKYEVRYPKNRRLIVD